MMATYDTAYQYIQDDVRRPDLQGVIIRRIQRAVTKYHRKDYWAQDVIETFVPFTDPTLSIQALDLNALFNYRKMLYVVKWRAVTEAQQLAPNTVYHSDFSEVAPDRMFDGYGYDKTDVMYRAGDSLKIKSSTPLAGVYIAYFSDPIIEPAANMTSWILAKWPNLIAAEVKARIFGDIGKDEEKKSAREETQDEFLQLCAANVRLTMS